MSRASASNKLVLLRRIALVSSNRRSCGMRFVIALCLLLVFGCTSSTPISRGDASDEDAGEELDGASDGDASDGDIPDGEVPDGTVPPDASCAAAPSGASSDACCPSGANANNDIDCTAVCGNGVFEAAELCDTGIIGNATGACPTSCTPASACDVAQLVSDACQTRCAHTTTTTPSGATSDGCCPAQATSLDDVDCAPSCGNGVKEAGELCDTAAQGAAACPSACPPRMACETGALTGSACTAQCIYTPITTSSGGSVDGCCPPGGTANTDVDCMAVCGNGVREAGEVCDTLIVPGLPDACPTSCTPTGTCDVAVMTGSACTAVCTHTPITMASGVTVDGCCPNGVDARTDIDCGPVCGNMILEVGEVCDRAAMTTDATCGGMCQDFKCRGQRYDVNGLSTDGCELSDTSYNNHSQATARDMGELTCFDWLSPLSLYGYVAHDLRAHVDPTIDGFESMTASAPDWFVVKGTGGVCFLDLVATLQVQSGDACFRLRAVTDRGTYTCSTDTTGMCSVSGTYTTDTFLYFRVDRICSSSSPAARGEYTVAGHL